jgi:hypothetical protein
MVSRENKGKGTHPKLESIQLCFTAITVGLRTLFLGEEAFISQVYREKLSLAFELAAGFLVQTFDGKFIYHLKGIKL